MIKDIDQTLETIQNVKHYEIFMPQLIMVETSFKKAC